MGLFRAILIILFSVVFIYVSHQLTRFADLPLALNLVVIAFVALVFGTVLAMPLFFWADRRREHKSWHDDYFRAAHFCLAYINFIVVFVVLRDLISFILSYTRGEGSWQQELYGPWALLWMLVLPVICVFLGTLVVRVGPKLKRVSVNFPGLPANLNGLRILHITDLHIGSSLPSEFIHKLVRVAKKSTADLVVYTGDILDGNADLHAEDIALLRDIRSRYGSFYVSGNHEYYWQAGKAFEVFKNAGFRILINEAESVRVGATELQVCGVPDPAARMLQLEGPDFEKLRSVLKPESFKVLLAHQPNIALIASPLGFNLQLSGHTHGGQFFPWNLLIKFFGQKFPKGLFKVQNMQLYVNQGTGYWGPSLRLGTFCELTEITLVKN